MENPRGNPEQREMAELRSRVNLGDFVTAAAAMRGVDGAAMEYSQALNLEAGRFPLSLLAPELACRDGCRRHGQSAKLG